MPAKEWRTMKWSNDPKLYPCGICICEAVKVKLTLCPECAAKNPDWAMRPPSKVVASKVAIRLLSIPDLLEVNAET